jgi:hypothetical protein
VTQEDQQDTRESVAFTPEQVEAVGDPAAASTDAVAEPATPEPAPETPVEADRRGAEQAEGPPFGPIAGAFVGAFVAAKLLGKLGGDD